MRLGGLEAKKVGNGSDYLGQLSNNYSHSSIIWVDMCVKWRIMLVVYPHRKWDMESENSVSSIHQDLSAVV
jgi:hypothetical protein